MIEGLSLASHLLPLMLSPFLTHVLGHLVPSWGVVWESGRTLLEEVDHWEVGFAYPVLLGVDTM